jgi:hypothetical protein
MDPRCWILDAGKGEVRDSRVVKAKGGNQKLKTREKKHSVSRF